jgi:hypothetical protein
MLTRSAVGVERDGDDRSPHQRGRVPGEAPVRRQRAPRQRARDVDVHARDVGALAHAQLEPQITGDQLAVARRHEHQVGGAGRRREQQWDQDSRNR